MTKYDHVRIFIQLFEDKDKSVAKDLRDFLGYDLIKDLGSNRYIYLIPRDRDMEIVRQFLQYDCVKTAKLQEGDVRKSSPIEQIIQKLQSLYAKDKKN